MRKIVTLGYMLLSLSSYAQHDNHQHNTANQSHLSHIQACREETVYIHNLPPPAILDGIGKSEMKIQTKSDKTQVFFNQGISLLHDFWDFEAYRAFKEAIRSDSSAIMPYWGLMQTLGPKEDKVFKRDKEIAVKQLKSLIKKAGEHEKLYAECALLADSLKDKAQEAIVKNFELIVHKYPEDVDAKLFLALYQMSGYDADLKPRAGQLYSEFLLKDLLRTHPTNHAVHHYWIHLKENCCPEQALESAKILTSLAPKSGHIVHMPGHIYYKIGDYKRAHQTFVNALKVDSAYMKDQGIQEVDNWNYIHNLNYLLANCAQYGQHKKGLYYAQKLKNMPVSKERKKMYEGVFFNQGILAPAKMELAFGYWDRAVKQLELVQDPDTVYGAPGMAFKQGLTLYAKGMDALTKNKVKEAIAYSNELDAFLWRNEKQSGKKTPLNKFTQSTINTASVELQGCIKSAQGKYKEAVKLLEEARKMEKELGYGEPPRYARPVNMSLAMVHEKERQWVKAIEAYNAILKHHPNSSYAYLGLAIVHRKKGDIAKAVEFENKLKEVNQPKVKTTSMNTKTES